MILGAAHVLMAVVYTWKVAHMDSARWPWDQYWQTLPMNTLRAYLWESLWNLHAQPPLFNLYGALFGRLFPSSYLSAMHVAQVVMVAASAGLAYVVGAEIFKNRAIAFGAALFYVAINPIFLLYEPMVFYTLPTAFLLTLSVACLAFYTRSMRTGFLYAFVVGMNLVVLLRSLYHLAILIPAIGLACLLARQQWRKMLLVGLVVSLCSFGWYAKNDVLFGFFGSSSWMGSNLWKIVSYRYSSSELQRLASQEIIDPMAAQLPPFQRPSVYAPYGFDRTSTVESLSHNDLHNINMIAISAAYERSAVRLIRHDPAHYLTNVYWGYRQFTSSELSRSYEASSSRLVLDHMRISNLLMYNSRLAAVLNRLSGAGNFPSILFFELPASLLAYCAALAWRGRSSVRRWLRLIQDDPVTCFSAFLIAYTTIIGSTLECGENSRFKVMVEPILWIFILAVAYRGIRFFWHHGEVMTNSGDNL